MWKPQQQENKQQNQQSANMIPSSNTSGLNMSNYLQQEWQPQMHSNYNYQQQPKGQSQGQMSNAFQNNFNSPQQQQQQSQNLGSNNWQTQPLQVPTPLPPQYADYATQQVSQQQVSNNMYKKQLQQQHQQQQQQYVQPQQNEMMQQHQAQSKPENQPRSTTPQTSSYFQQPQVSLYSPASFAESGHTSNSTLNTVSNFSHDYGKISVQNQTTPSNNNTPQLQNFFDQPKVKEGDGVDGWDDWEWNDINVQKELDNNASENPNSNNIRRDSYNQHDLKSMQNFPPTEQLRNQENTEHLKQKPYVESHEESEIKKSTAQTNQQKPQLKDVINDNWHWGLSDDSKEKAKNFENPERKSVENFNLEDSFNRSNNINFFNTEITQQPFVKEENQEKYQSIEDETFQKSNFNQDLENEQNTQSLPANNAVFITQAMPVSQPPKQFAIPPKQDNSSFFGHTQNTDISAIPPPQMPSVGSELQDENALDNKVTQLPPPPLMQQSQAINNPFKRAGPALHGRAGALLPPPPAPVSSNLQLPNSSQQNFASSQFFSPPPPAEFQNTKPETFPSYNQENQEIVSPDNFEIVNDNVGNSVTTSDRNSYMQISHLSEDGNSFNNTNQNQQSHTQLQTENDTEEQLNENDAFPPPGLSRLVLGQPETENTNISTSNYIPPSFDRMIPGTELVSSSILNLERQADGQDTIPSPTSAFSNVQPSNIDMDVEITSDRNLYQVPGKSENNENQKPQVFAQTGSISSSMPQNQNQRFVTGLENTVSPNPTNSDQRELELDGENLEDEQQLQQQQLEFASRNFSAHQAEVDISVARDGPIEGASTQDLLTQNKSSKSDEIESSLVNAMNDKLNLSMPSTANDESDDRSERPKTGRRLARHLDDKRSKRSSDNEPRMDYDQMDTKKNDRYYSEESEDNSSDNRDKRRSMREGSSKHTRDKYKSNPTDRKEKSHNSSNSIKYRDAAGREHRQTKNERSNDERNASERNRMRRSNNDKTRDRYDVPDRKERKSERDRESGRERASKNNRYENDSRYETEGSRYYRGDSDQDTYGQMYRRDERDRRYKSKRDEREDQNDGRMRDRRKPKADERNDYKYEDRKDKHRRSKKDKNNKSDYDDEYRKGSSSRNASEREKDHVRSARNKNMFPQMYGYPNVYNYDFTYYQQQQYYEQLRRTNPQAYTEWYNKYYAENASHFNADLMNSGVGGSLNVSGVVDGRESVHSGRSSANNEKERVDDMSLTIGDSVSLTQELNRLTPQKFTNEHSVVSLSAGVMVYVKPKYMQKNGSKIVKIVKLGCNDSTRRLFQAFPGPLVRGITHKKTIIEFCEDQIRLGPPSYNKLASRQNSMSSLNSFHQTNKASFVLMWNLLILLLRQNGVVIGTDIAELLIRNQKEFPYENKNFSTTKSGYKRNSVDYRGERDESADEDNANRNFSKSEEETDSEIEDIDHDDNVNKKTKQSESSLGGSAKQRLSENEITEKFRNYLLYGNINEALDWASDNNLWGHALFLASKVDRRLYANVMMKFANKLPFNDPLQTLYQLMSYKIPASVTSIQDEKWGDWRPHLAMILSNTSQRPDLDRRAITTLGDSLYNRGDHFAAHFCFLMAQVGFGTYYNAAKQHESSQMLNSQNAIRLILLGSPFNKNFKEFANNEAIMMTEIYEYACSLNDDKFSIPEFQPYKYLLATRMVDYGFQIKALMYLEQVALHIKLDPTRYDMSFISKVVEFSDRLKYYDPTIEKTLDRIDSNDPKFGEVIDQFETQKWLQDLQNVLGDYKPEVIETNKSLKEYENLSYNQSQQYDNQNENLVDQFRAINQQFSELNSQYNSNNSYLLDPASSQNQQLSEQNNLHSNTIVQSSLLSGGSEEYERQQFYDPNIMQQQTKPENSSIENENISQMHFQNPAQQLPPNQNANLYPGSDNQIASQQQQQQTYANNQMHDYNWNQSVDQNTSESELKDHKTESVSSKIETVSAQSIIKDKNIADLIATEKLKSNSFDQIRFDKKYLNTDILTISKLNSIEPLAKDTITSKANFVQTDLSKQMQPTAAIAQQQQQQKREKLRNSSINHSTSLSNKSLGQTKNFSLKEQQQKKQHQIQQHHQKLLNHQQSQPIKDEVPRPSISLPNTNASQNKGYYEDVEERSGAPLSATEKNFADKSKDKQKTVNEKNESKNQQKSSNSSQNSTWFGGIWNKLSLKPKNQMILPDDKNPTIVWDAEKKRWVNTDGDVTESESFRPPPKMSEINPMPASTPPSAANSFQEQQSSSMPLLQQQQEQQPQLQQQYNVNYDQNQSQYNSLYQEPQQQQFNQQPMTDNVAGNSTATESSASLNNSQMLSGSSTNLNASLVGTGVGGAESKKVPNLQSNMFKMQRNRTLKKSYVDVFNPSGAAAPKPAEPILAPIMPSIAPQTGFFIPAPVDGDQNNQQEGAPQFYNPNQFGGYQQ